MDVVIKPKLPKPETPFDSLIQGLKLMPDEVLSRDQTAWLRLIETMDERERLVLKARHALDREPRQTLQAMAGRLGVAKEWVRQVQLRGHWHLRKLAIEGGLVRPDAPNRLATWTGIEYWPPGSAPRVSVRQ